MELIPTQIERTLVARCLLTEGVLIGSEDEIWTSSLAERALRTLRKCIAAISKLRETGYGIYASWIKSVVSQEPGEAFVLDEMAEFLCKDNQARHYWDTTVADSRFPHRCPFCKVAAAFIGFNQVDCKGRCRA